MDSCGPGRWDTGNEALGARQVRSERAMLDSFHGSAARSVETPMGEWTTAAVVQRSWTRHAMQNQDRGQAPPPGTQSAQSSKVKASSGDGAGAWGNHRVHAAAGLLTLSLSLFADWRVRRAGEPRVGVQHAHLLARGRQPPPSAARSRSQLPARWAAKPGPPPHRQASSTPAPMPA